MGGVSFVDLLVLGDMKFYPCIQNHYLRQCVIVERVGMEVVAAGGWGR